jgi:hypothetical protein
MKPRGRRRLWDVSSASRRVAISAVRPAHAARVLRSMTLVVLDLR